MNRTTIIWIGIALVVIFGGWKIYSYNTTPGKLDAFAQCIADEGATFYGTFWCPHCQSQKAAFGRSARLLPYEECSTPDGRGQREVCTEKEVNSYPTWEFADGSRLMGEVPLARLAEETSCELPQ